MNETDMTCAEADGILLDYFEGTLNQATHDRFAAHASSCARCSGLIRDVNDITAQAASLPLLTPSQDLWKGVEARIQPAVVPIAFAARTSGGKSRAWMAAAAAALVVSTASITYFATSRTMTARVADSRPAGPQPLPPVEMGNSEMDEPIIPASPVRVVESDTDETEVGSRPSRATVSPSPRIPRPTTSRTSLVSAATTDAEREYGDEIQRLQTVLNTRRGELDASTVKVVEDNLKLIDMALNQARAALTRDPASGFLTDQLNNVLEKKVELLRTVALLPSRT
ncbi:MAG TPA: hypothetical protein VM939_11420 [Gemmatimonadaceae bacterium]|nr:hypothetical protein [Gemmatimonadaceae bacterium]